MYLKLILLVILCALSTYKDVRVRKIPNKITIQFIFAGIVLNGIIEFPNGILTGVLGFGVGFVIFLVPYLMKAMGAGDVKMMAAIGAITNARAVLWIALLTAVSGGIIVIVMRARSGGLLNTFKNTGKLMCFYVLSLVSFIVPLPTLNVKKEKYRVSMSDDKKENIPYAVAISAGVVLAYVLPILGLMPSIGF